MSADLLLLRRAAAKLREASSALPGTMTGGWFTRQSSVAADDGSPAGMLVMEAYNPAEDEPVLEHIALSASPPVALALAETLDYIGNPMTCNIGERLYELAEGLARAILREPS